MSSYPVIVPPERGEYLDYYHQYISLVPGRDLLSYFQTQTESVATLANSLSEEESLFRYAPNKWSVKDVLCHIIDSEHIFGYRTLRIARGDKTELAGFDENAFAREAHADSRSINDIISEYSAIRHTSIELFKSLDNERLLRTGTANKATVSVRALGYIIAGHEMHHLSVIKARYLGTQNR
ncbi:MAG TPA: DinB family protein [Candidatus Kapabacteria bacterium]|nr:DinB family protein [Candidatus Kapabacteria bacterium]